MAEVNEPKPIKKGKSRPSFSAPVFTSEARAAGWVDVAPSAPIIDPIPEAPAPEPVRATALEPVAVAIPEPADRPAPTRKLTIRPRTRVALRPETIEVPRERERPEPPVIRQAMGAAPFVAGLSVTIGIVVASAYVALEMIALPARIAAGIFGSRNKR